GLRPRTHSESTPSPTRRSSDLLAIFGLSSAYHTRRVTEQTATDLGLNAPQTAELLQVAGQPGSEVSAGLSAALTEAGAGVEQVLESITVASLDGAIGSVGYLLTGLLVLALALTPLLARRGEVQKVSGELEGVTQN